MKVSQVLILSILVVLFFIAILAGGLFFYTEQLYSDSYTSEYSYKVSISPSDPISNITVLVPLPKHNNISLVNTSMLSDPLKPKGWRYNVIDHQGGPMLEIKADKIPQDPSYYHSIIRDNRLVGWEEITESQYNPENSSHIRLENDEVRIDLIIPSKNTIDTKSPINDESLLYPHENLSETRCFMDQDQEECYTYSGYFFVSYNSSQEISMYISAELRGSNSWWVLGWNFNEYIDRQSVEIINQKEGWVETNGVLEVAQGNYRDPP